MPVPAILDHLIATGKIPPLVVVFVYQTAERNGELACSEPFSDFLAKELVPWVRKNYNVSPEPAARDRLRHKSWRADGRLLRFSP